MSLLSLAYLLLDRPCRSASSRIPLFQATVLLLQERIPKATAFYSHAADMPSCSQDCRRPGDRRCASSQPGHADPRSASLVQRQIPRDGHQRRRRLQPLEGHRGHALARGHHPRQLGHVLSTSATWRAANSGRPPTSRRSNAPKSYEAIFSEARAEFRRRDHDIETHTEIAVSPEDDIELRRITHHQPFPDARTIEVTSYAEVVLALAGGGRAHPAFSNLFVQTEILRRAAGDSLHPPAPLRRRDNRRGCST